MSAQSRDDGSRQFRGRRADRDNRQSHNAFADAESECEAASAGYERLVTAYAREAAERAALAAEDDDIGADFDDDYTQRDSDGEPRRDQVDEVSR